MVIIAAATTTTKKKVVLLDFMKTKLNQPENNIDSIF